MSPCERGFVVPLWVRNRLSGPTFWTAVWALPGRAEWLQEPHSPCERYAGDEFRPRDPNRAGDPPGDRPDLLE